MKRFLSFFMAACLATGFAACSESNEVDDPKKEDPENPTPGPGDQTAAIFPEAVTGEVTGAGKDNGFRFTVTGNLDWSIKLAENENDWFVLTDNVAETTEYTGSADEKKEFIVYTGYEETFEGHACQVVMTMGGESKIIAYVSQGHIERTFTLYTTLFDNGDFVYSPTGLGWEYLELQGEDTIELHFPFGNSMYQQHLAVTANFDWEIKSAPLWIEIANEKLDATGLHVLDLRAANYKLEEPTGEIVFADKGDASATYSYTITIPNYGQYFDMIPQTLAEFNAEGLWYSNDSWTSNVPSSTVTTIDGFRVFAYAKVNEQSGSYYDINQDWITTETSASDDNALFIKGYKISARVAANTSEDNREGVVLVIPVYVLDKILEENPGLTDDELAAQFAGLTVAPEYEQYILYYITQKGYEPTPIITAVTEEPDMRAAGAYFGNAAKDSWFKNNLNFRGISYFYQLAFTEKISDDKTPMFRLGSEYYNTEITFAYYDSDAMPMDDSWLAAKYVEYTDPDLEDDNENKTIKVIRIQMDPDNDHYEGFDYQHEGFVTVLSDGTPIACIYCIFDEDFQPADPDAENKTIAFENPESVEGAELVAITKNNYADYGISDSEFNELTGQRTAIYYLIYTSESPKNATLTTPVGYYLMTMPWGISWLTTSVEYPDKTKSTLDVTMTAPEGSQTVGIINIQKDLSGAIIDIRIYCKPAFAL